MNAFSTFSANAWLHMISVGGLNYYPFGMIMPGRAYDSGSEYRYGFQGQETDNEMLGGAVSYKYRVHDARIGKFLSVDPLAPKYPFLSPYQFSSNQPIHARELEGLESSNHLGSGEVSPFTYETNDTVHTSGTTMRRLLHFRSI